MTFVRGVVAWACDIDEDIRRDCSIFGLGQVQQEGCLKTQALSFFKILPNKGLKICPPWVTGGRPARRVTHHKEEEEKLNGVD
jgi:putative component of membrane protein insertase Oxa1/YidC/SpoIIIJ protein YidD